MAVPKKILIAYVKFPPIAEDLKCAFEELGIEVETFLASDIPISYFHKMFCKRMTRWAWALGLLSRSKALFMNHPKRWENVVADALYEKYKAFEPDLLFFIHEPAYGGFGNKVLNKIKCKKIGWYVEPFEDLDRLRNNCRHFEIYNSFHLSAVEKLAKEGVQVSYLCHAVSPKRFFPLNNQAPTFDLSFVGNFSPWRDEVVRSALEVTGDIALYGPGWLKHSRIPQQTLHSIYKGAMIAGQDLNSLFNSSKVVLSASRLPGSSGLNMRFFEVLASRACFLTDFPPELERHFVADEHLVTYENLESLKAKLRFLLKEDVIRNRIALAGYEQVMGNHTYAQMAEIILGQYSVLVDSPQREKSAM